MSVEMNYPMVQYLRHALQNEKDAAKKLNRILGITDSANLDVDKGANRFQVVTNSGIMGKFVSYFVLVLPSTENLLQIP